MEVRPGYKQTEVGVIPEDWGVRQIIEVCDFIVPGRNKPQFSNGTIPWITTPDLEDGGKVFESRLGLSVSRAEANSVGSRVVPVGSVVMSCVGELGITAYAERDIVINQQLHAFIPSNLIDGHFLLHAVRTRKSYLEGIATKTALPYLNKDNCNSIRLPFPPLQEQRAIAAALSDVDALLAKLDQFIAKKRDLKQAAMQQLLAGQTRLPGFSGEWEVRRLGDVASATKGSQLHSSESRDSGRFAHLNGGITPSGYTETANTPGGTIAISEGGNSCGYVQFMAEPYWCGGHCYSVIPRGIDNGFLYHALKGQQTAIMALRVGSGLPNVQKTALLNFGVSFPVHGKEQTAIATVLSDMDAELAALEGRREKTRALKQGMMQALLTGRIRLI